MKQRWLLGGSFDGRRIGFECDPPSMLDLGGEKHTLGAGRYIVSTRKRAVAFTAARKRELLEHVAAGETIGRACELAGVSSACVYRHRHLDPEFGRELDRMRKGDCLTSWHGGGAAT